MKTTLLPTDSPKYLKRLAQVLNYKADIYHDGRRIYGGTFAVETTFGTVGVLRHKDSGIIINVEKLYDGNMRQIVACRSTKRI